MMRLFDRWLGAFERRLLTGFDAEETALAHLRAMQLDRLVGHSPMLMFANLVNALVVSAILLWIGVNVAVMLWLGAVVAYVAAGMRSAHARREAVPGRGVGLRAIRRLVANCAVLGLLWGALPIIVFAQYSGFPEVLAMTVFTGMLGGGAIALGFVPVAAIVFVSVATACCTLALGVYADAQMTMFLPLVIIYALALMKSAAVHGRSFARSVVSEAQIREHASTIGILLREYEYSSRDWIWETDSDGVLVRGIEELSAACDIPVGEMDEALRAIASGAQPAGDIQITGFEEMAEQVSGREIVRGLLLGVGRAAHEPSWFRFNGKPLHENRGEYSGYRGMVSNVTEETRVERQVRFLAHYDSMTGLMNRSAFQDYLNRAVATEDQPSVEVAVMYVDLDGFKSVNDVLGHHVGDALLAEVAGRMTAVIEPDGVAARLGGDEFAVVMAIEGQPDKAERMAERLIEEIGRPYVANGQRCTIGASVGIACSGQHGRSASALLHAADLALYRSKQAGKGMFHIFDREMDDTLRRSIYLEQELRQAIATGQLSLRFQPFFRPATREPAGFEALVRWSHPVLGEVSPARFLPVAEKIGFVNELDDWVLWEACRIAAEWPHHLRLAVNVSVAQFDDRRIVHSLRAAAAEAGFETGRIDVEVTEHVFAEKPGEVAAVMEQLKSMGVMVALDDFGTGHSSLLHLMNFPVDKLKIDRSFVRTAVRNDAARDVFETMVELGRKLSLETIAEGVETEAQMAMVEAVGCTFCQGHLLGMPMPAAELAPFMLNPGRRWHDEQPRTASVA